MPGSMMRTSFASLMPKKTRNKLSKWVGQGTITGDQADVYKKILKSGALDGAQKTMECIAQNSRQTICQHQSQYEGVRLCDQWWKKCAHESQDSIRHHQMHMQMAAGVGSATSGRGQVWIGGINHKYFRFDHVTSNGQVGSTFKPLCLWHCHHRSGHSPCYKVQDISYCIQANDSDFGLMSTWCPSNADGKFSGSFLTKRGFKKSQKFNFCLPTKQLQAVGGGEEFL